VVIYLLIIFCLQTIGVDPNYCLPVILCLEIHDYILVSDFFFFLKKNKGLLILIVFILVPSNGLYSVRVLAK
jgi:hypothetical protein